MENQKSRIVEEWEPGMFVRVDKIDKKLPAIIETVNQPDKVVLRQAKMMTEAKLNREKIEIQRKKEYNEIFESGFKFLPLKEIQNKYSLLKSEEKKREFFDDNLSQYRSAWAWYTRYDAGDNDFKAMVDFLNTEFDKLGVEKNMPEQSKGDSFKDFLDERGKLILPQLISRYSGKKTKRLTVMIFALISLSLLKSEILSNKAELNRMLTDTFGYPGDPAGLRKTILIYTSPGPDQENEIKIQASIIREFLSSPTAN